MALSARNQLSGRIEELKLGNVMAQVAVRVGDNLIESVITRSSAEELQLKVGDMVKAVVDVERRVMAVGGDLHADEEAVLLDRGSRQGDIWGFNLYPERYGNDDWIEYDSMINIRPRHGNRSRLVEDRSVQQAIAEIVSSLVMGDD